MWFQQLVLKEDQNLDVAPSGCSGLLQASKLLLPVGLDKFSLTTQSHAVSIWKASAYQHEASMKVGTWNHIKKGGRAG